MTTFDAPARYFPITRGRYEVAPDLKPLDTDFGNGAFVIRVFHLTGEQIRSNPSKRARLISALKSVTPESRRYKGVEASIDLILAWLAAA